MADSLSHKIELTADTRQFNQQMESAEERVKRLEQTAGRAGAAIALKIGVAVAAVAKLGQNFLNVANRLGQLTAGTNMSVSSLSRWGYVATRVGADASSAQGEIASLQKELRGEKYTGRMSSRAQFARMQGISTEGKTGSQVMAALNATFNGLKSQDSKDRFSANAQEFGFSDNEMTLITASAKTFQQSLQDANKALPDTKTSLDGARKAAADFGAALLEAGQKALPAYTGATEAATAALATLKDGLDGISAWLEKLAKWGAIVAGAFGVIGGFLPGVLGVFRMLLRFAGPIGVLITGITALNYALEKFTGKNLLAWGGEVVDKVKKNGVVQTIVDGAHSLRDAVAADMQKDMQEDARDYTPTKVTRSVASHEYYVRQLMAQGMPRNAAIGYATNIMAESGGKSDAFNPAGGGKGAYGLMQWRGSRLTDLLHFSGKRDKSDVTTQDQIRFIAHEARTTERRGYEQVANAGTSDLATKLVSDKIERHGNAAETAKRVRANQEFVRANPGLATAQPAASSGQGMTIGTVNVTLPNATNAQHIAEGLSRLGKTTMQSASAG